MIYGSLDAPNPKVTDKPTDLAQRSAVCVNIPRLFLEAPFQTYIRTYEMRG
jgi:hypothetical protein